MSLHTEFAQLKMPLQDIRSATNDFADENIIGQGGFGRVYKGQLLQPDGQQIDIAARRLDPRHGQGSKEFWTEISLLSTLNDSYIVSIVGFCDENDENIIISKHEARGSLDKYLSDPTLTWLQRLQICYHVALALRYIHYDAGRDFSIIHRNIQSSKILLSDDWEPKLSGFGFSITNTTDRRNRSVFADVVCGTRDYIDPTYAKTSFVTHKSDMYSFGVVLFEVLCGRKAIQVNESLQSLATLAKLHYEEGTLDKIIHSDLRERIDPRSLSLFSETAYACLNDEPSQRPDADQTVKRLEKAYKFQLRQDNPMKEIEKIKGVQQVPKLKVDQVQQLTNNLEDTSMVSANDYNEKELSREVDGKKHLIVSASKVLFTPEEIKHLKSKPAAELKRSEYVMELLPRHVYRIKYEIDSKMLSPFTEYTCYLVFKLSKKCLGLHCPVIVRDKLHRKNKDAKIIYFRTPALWNQQDAIWVPKQRKDGWTEVMVWRFNSKRKLRTDSIPMNLKLISYEGSMSGLIVCGLEFRPT